MKRKGFTLVELLVVIAIIALLMGILMPALARVRQLAFRMTCGTNLSGIGKAMLIYANDYQDELPRAGGRASTWGALKNWMATDRYTAYGVAPATGDGGTASISSCFYLLVKYSEVTPKSFICKGDAGTTEFKLSELPTGTVPTNYELIDAWDFGPEPAKKCSYSYHLPFGTYALTTSSEPGFAVAADRNPWITSPAGAAQTWASFKPDLDAVKGTNEQARAGNAMSHQQDGQNVLFLDSHVEFAKRSYCSIEDDNIYTVSRYGTEQRGDAWGLQPTAGNATPACRKDSLLVHDDPSIVKPKPRCFAPETPVWVDGRLMPIGEVVAGQAVGMPCANQVAFRSSPCRIEGVDVHTGAYDDVYMLILENGETLHVGGSHVFLLDNGTWAQLEELRAGSVLRTNSGSIRVSAAIHQIQPYVGTVYNLRVKDSDRYFAGRAGVVVRDY